MLFHRIQIPKPDPKIHIANDLDAKLELDRIETLKYIKNSATALRENATDLDEALAEVENFASCLKHLAFEVIMNKIFS